MYEYKFIYLLLGLILLPFWIILFIHRKDLRRKMLVLSFLIGFTALIGGKYYYLRDYWNPIFSIHSKLLIEDFIFGFLFGGIASVFYEELFGKRLSSRHIRKHNWALFFIVIVGFSSFIANILFFNLGINSMYSSLFAFAVAAIGIFLFRKDLFIDAVMSGILCGIILIFAYGILFIFYPLMFDAFWQLGKLSGISIGNIPIEEFLWAFGLGMLVGPMYEFYAGLSVKKVNRR